MNEQQLLYFKRLAASQNLSRTAQELMISPPALSASLRRLEEEAGCPLFDRTGRSLRLNENGRILLRRADEALAALSAAREELAAARRPARAHLTVGLTSPLICHDALQSFVRLHPDIQLAHRLLRADQMSSPALGQEVDFVIASTGELPEWDWEGATLLAKNPMVLVVYPSHPFAGRTGMRLQEAAGERFIAIPREYCFRRFMDKVFEAAGFTPNIVLECDFALRSAMLAARHGILLVSAAVQTTEFFSLAVCIPLTEPAVDYPRLIYRARQGRRSGAAEVFWAFMISFYEGAGA